MKKIACISIFLIAFNCFAQGEANYWYFGLGAGIDFNGGSATAISGSLFTTEGCSSFSDKDGNLLFYSDGRTVWNKNHAPMPNGINLLGNSSSTQSAIIVPYPLNPDKYYIFTVGTFFDSSQSGFNAYVVDITADGGLGDIVDGPINLSDGKDLLWTEKVTSVKGEDCNSYWIISLVENTFYTYKVDSNGLDTSPVISPVDYSSEDRRGYLKVSPDGKKLATAIFNLTQEEIPFNGKLLLYNFDDSTGIVSNDAKFLINNTAVDGEPYGVEFSPLSSKLYCSTFDGSNNRLYQFDLLSSPIRGSKTLIKSQVGYRGALQLAPNGKIYATVSPNYFMGTNFLDAINAPEELGINCDYQLNALNLGTGQAMQGLPPFIASILLPVEITNGITTQNINKTTVKRCMGESFSLSAENIPGNPVYEWTFNNTLVGSNTTLDLPNLGIADAGTYYLKIDTIDDCGFKISYEGEVYIEVHEMPTITKPVDILQCDDDNDGYYSFDLKTLKDLEVLDSQDDTIFEVLYFNSQADVDANTNPLEIPYTNSTAYTPETIFVRIHNIQGPTCYKTESFNIQVFESPNPSTTIDDFTKCDSNIIGNDTDGLEEFNLTDKIADILNGQSAADFNIDYFTDAALTQAIATPGAFINTQTLTQTIYIRVQNKFYTDCEATTSFDLEVFALPKILDNYTFKQCDEDGTQDGFTDFNLDEANDFLTLGDNALTATYHANFADADNALSPITTSPHSNQTLPTVFARIENSNGCHRVAQVSLVVSATRFPQGFLHSDTACDDDGDIDGLREFDLSAYDHIMKANFPPQDLVVSYYESFTDVQLEINEIPKDQPYMMKNPFVQTIYVRVESVVNGECFGFGPHLELTVQPRPEFELDQTEIYCQNLPPILVSPYNSNGNYTYEWTDESGGVISTIAEAMITKEGIYTVVATSQEGCKSFPHSITIEPSNIAAITLGDITIVDDSANNSININTSNLGVGDYEYTLDDEFGIYQDDPSFENVAPGIHTILVRDKNDCGITSIDVSVIGYPKFFTPNNDGINDTWKVLGVSEDFYASSNIFIFDRFGKLISLVDPKGQGWNGLLNGEFLPSTDYWFSVELIDKNGNIKLRNGHFSLIRR